VLGVSASVAYPTPFFSDFPWIWEARPPGVRGRRRGPGLRRRLRGRYLVLSVEHIDPLARRPGRCARPAALPRGERLS